MAYIDVVSKVQLRLPARQMIIADRNDATRMINNCFASHRPGGNLTPADDHAVFVSKKSERAQYVVLPYTDEILW